LLNAAFQPRAWLFAPEGEVGAIGPGLGKDSIRASEAACGDLRRLAALDLPCNPLSTQRRQPDILVDVHPVLSSQN